MKVTFSRLTAAISGKIIGLSLGGNSDIQITAAAASAETVTCKFVCK